MKYLFVGLVCISLLNPAFAAEGRWVEGFGQGNLEYFQDQDGIRLYIACPTQDGSSDLPSYVSLTRLQDDTDIEAFTLSVNGESYDGPFSADSRVGENNFLSLLESLRKDHVTVNFNGQSVVFKKSNAVDVLPVYGENFHCNLM